jgi:predicted membrane protein
LSPAQSASVNLVILVIELILAVVSATARFSWPLKVILTLIVFYKYCRVCWAELACIGAGLEQCFKSVEIVKARSSWLPNIVYIINLIAC